MVRITNTNPMHRRRRLHKAVMGGRGGANSDARGRSSIPNDISKANLEDVLVEAELLLEREHSLPICCRAGLLTIIIREDRALVGDAIDVGRAIAHVAEVIGADIPVSDIVAHDDEDSRLLQL